MKITSLDAIHIAYSINEYLKNNSSPVNCNVEKLQQISSFLLNINNLEKSFTLSTNKKEPK